MGKFSFFNTNSILKYPSFLKVPCIFFTGVLVLLLVAVLAAHPDISIDILISDPKLPYDGFLTKLGILLWCSTATICFFTASVLSIFQHDRYLIQFLLFWGCMTSLLMFDDLFLLHEYDGILSKYLGLGRFGFSEKYLFLLYGGLLVFGFIKFLKQFMQPGNLLFYCALLFFGMSIVFDTILVELGKDWFGTGIYYFLEEGLKWLGIMSWFGYFSRFCYSVIYRYSS